MDMAKADESLAAAALCYAQGFYNAVANRAYYAMFQAAQVALETRDSSVPSGAMRAYMRPLPRCVDILVDTGVFLCAAVYAPDR